MKLIVFFGVVTCTLTMLVANRAQRIRGGSNSGNGLGDVSILTLESPEEQVVVVVKYPKPVDTSWWPGYGHSGNGGDDVTNWERLYKKRYKEQNEFVELTIHWKYSIRTRKLCFADKEFDFPQGKLAILSYDGNQKPLCELLESNPENIQRVKKQFSSTRTENSIPSAPAPDLK